MLIFPAQLFSQQIDIMTFNIRYNNPGDKENAWPNRKEMVCGLLDFHDPDIFGLQEALYDQILDIQKCLPGYEWLGQGRDDGDKKGEFSPIFYNTSKFILVKKGHFWLSETPDKPGLGWDAACNRIVCWGRFQSKVTGKHFLVFNTHFDHLGKEARKNSAVLLRNTIEEMTYNKALPVILTGDFNLTPDELPISLLKKYLSDARDISVEKPYGPVGTFSGFKFDADFDKRIDYVFVNGFVRVLEYAALTDSKEKRYPSDHLPVFVKVQLK
jgi:endonuclease/exonuclease/phosphatase family metal-dependent hydrolase